MGGGGGKGYSAPAPAPVPSQEELIREAEDEEAKAIAKSQEDARLAALQSQGRDGTILTSFGDTGTASVQRKTLLGQ